MHGNEGDACVNGETTKYIKHDFQVTSLKRLFLNLHPSEIKTTTSRTRQNFLRFFRSFFGILYEFLQIIITESFWPL
jgi:hypothetical protein